MKKIEDFSEYVGELVLESLKRDEVFLVLSDRLKYVLGAIKHPIAEALLSSDRDPSEVFKVTFVDIEESPDRRDIISFMQSSKVISEFIKRHPSAKGKENIAAIFYRHYRNSPLYLDEEFFHSRYRSTTRIGRLMKKLFDNDFPESGDEGRDIQSFVDMYKAVMETTAVEEVKGGDIRKWYLSDNYIRGGGDLNGSCMRHKDSQPLLDLYVENPDKVSMLILRDTTDDTKIRGRALLWKLSEPEGRMLMDRIYFVEGFEKEIFRNYAIKHKLLMKRYQNASTPLEVVDTTKNTQEDIIVVSVDGIRQPSSGMFPYLDTLKYMDCDEGIMSNAETILDHRNRVCALTGVEGHDYMVYDRDAEDFVGNESSGDDEGELTDLTEDIYQNTEAYVMRYPSIFLDNLDKEKAFQDYVALLTGGYHMDIFGKLFTRKQILDFLGKKDVLSSDAMERANRYDLKNLRELLLNTNHMGDFIGFAMHKKYPNGFDDLCAASYGDDGCTRHVYEIYRDFGSYLDVTSFANDVMREMGYIQ